jgi:hypothetical protein
MTAVVLSTMTAWCRTACAFLREARFDISIVASAAN